MSYWASSAEAGPSRSPHLAHKSFAHAASSSMTKDVHVIHLSSCVSVQTRVSCPDTPGSIATEHDLYDAQQKSLHVFAYGGLAHSSPSAETSSTFSPAPAYRTTFSNPSSSSVSSSGQHRTLSHRNSFSSVSVSEFGSSAMSDRMSWGRSLKRQSKRSSQDVKYSAGLRTPDLSKRDGNGRHRSHTEGSQASNHNSGDIFLYSSRNVENSSDRSHQPRFMHQRRKSDGPQRSKLDASLDSYPHGRTHRIIRSQSSNTLSNAFSDGRNYRHQPRNSANNLSLVKDEDEEVLASNDRIELPSSPLRESETFADWKIEDPLPSSSWLWKRIDDQDALDRLAIMSSSISAKTLRRRSGEVVNGAARSAAHATKKSLRAIRRAGSFDVGLRNFADAAGDRNRSRSNSSSSILNNFGSIPRIDLRHRRSQTLFEINPQDATMHTTSHGGTPPSLSLPPSATHSPKLQGLGLSADGAKPNAWRFSQIIEAEDEDKSFSKDLPQVLSGQATTPSSASDQEMQLQRSNSSAASKESEPHTLPSARAEASTTISAPSQREPPSPGRSLRDRRHGLAKRSYAALIDLLNPRCTRIASRNPAIVKDRWEGPTLCVWSRMANTEAEVLLVVAVHLAHLPQTTVGELAVTARLVVGPGCMAAAAAAAEVRCREAMEAADQAEERRSPDRRGGPPRGGGRPH